MSHRSFEVDVEPKVLVWARESIGISKAEVAKRFDLDEDVITKWETGQEKPTIVQIKRLAEIYKRPLAVFFLPEPPEEPPLPRDFRTLPKERRNPLSPRTRLAIRRAQRLQSLTLELAKLTDREIHTHMSTASLHEDPEIVADKTRERIGIDIQTQFAWSSSDDALKEWRKAIENLGVLVFQLALPVEETRGFSLSGNTLPAIVVNVKDKVNARIFTLFHEYGHLLLGTGGICDLENQNSPSNKVESIEEFCNHFAGAFLVPGESLLNHELVMPRRGISEWSDDHLRRMAKDFKVSQEVILRRLVTLELASWDFYRAKYEKWKQVEKAGIEKIKSQKARQNIPQECIRENSVPFVSLVLDSYRKEKITYSDIADYLGILTKHIPKVEQLME